MNRYFNSKQKAQAIQRVYDALITEQMESVVQHLQLINEQQLDIDAIHQNAAEIELSCLYLMDKEVAG